MKTIQDYIKIKQAEFGQGPLFKHIRQKRPLQQTMGFAPYLAFWVMTFQDALRLNAILTKDPDLKQFASHHMLEDSGHEKWFMQDLSVMFDEKELTIDWLYGPTCAPIRDGSYTIMAELIKAENDKLRTVLLLALESTSQVFSETITTYISEIGYGDQLKYFSKTHCDAENEHAMYEEEGEQQLHAIKFTPQEKEKAFALVDYIYTIFYSMADGCLKEVEKEGLLKFRPNLYSGLEHTVDKARVA